MRQNTQRSARSTIPALILLGITTGTAAAQGDDCTMPETGSWVGTGTFPFDLTNATASGYSGGGGLGCAVGATVDGFLAWTVPADGAYVFSTTGTDLAGASAGETLAVYEGPTCGGTCLDGDAGDDARVVVRERTAGETLLVQVGSLGGPPAASGTVTIVHHPTPVHDTCATPMPVGVGRTVVDTLAATTTAFDGGAAPCTGSRTMAADVFLVFTSPADSAYRIETFDNTIDTILSVHLGTDCSATCWNTNDVGDAETDGARLEIRASIGDAYLIQVGGWSFLDASDQLNVDILALPTPPPNDTCMAPTVLPAGVGSTPFDTTAATASGFDGGGSPCAPIGDSGGPAPDLFFSWTPSNTGDYDIEISGIGYESILVNLHVGTGCTAVCLAVDEKKPGPATNARIALIGAPAGQPYVIQVGSWLWTSETTNGTLAIRDLVLPPNTDCSMPTSISGETTVFWSNFHPGVGTSGFDGGVPNACPSGANTYLTPPTAVAADLFYVWTATCDGAYRFDTLASPFLLDTKISLHVGSDCGAPCLDYDDDSGSIDGAASVTIYGVEEGDTYLVQVGSAQVDSPVGQGALSVTRLGESCVGSTIAIHCPPPSLHHEGGAVTLGASSFGALTGSGLHVEAFGGPHGSFGILLVGTDTSALIPVQRGLLCLPSPQGQYGTIQANQFNAPQVDSLGVFDPTGQWTNLSGTSTTGTGFDVPTFVPIGFGATVDPGDTWSFQLWYRDVDPVVGPSSNLSDAIEVTFP